MNILITGHKGFVGRYFCKKYENHNIIGIDIADNIDARDFFAKDRTKFDLVIHLAAIVGGRATIEGNPISVATDLEIDSRFFNWCLLTKPRRAVYFSSSAAYPIELQRLGSTTKLAENMINLEDIRSPDYTYGWAKLTGEYLAKFVSNEVPITIFRPFSGYGADQSLDYPFPSFIQRAKYKYDPFDIWGDGNQVRDFIHMQDVVDAVDTFISQDISGTFNLGTGRPISFNDLCDMACKQANFHPKINHIKSNPVGVMYRVADTTLMNQYYTPKISLEEGIALALK